MRLASTKFLSLPQFTWSSLIQMAHHSVLSSVSGHPNVVRAMLWQDCFPPVHFCWPSSENKFGPFQKLQTRQHWKRMRWNHGDTLRALRTQFLFNLWYGNRVNIYQIGTEVSTESTASHLQMVKLPFNFLQVKTSTVPAWRSRLMDRGGYCHADFR